MVDSDSLVGKHSPDIHGVKNPIRLSDEVLNETRNKILDEYIKRTDSDEIRAKNMHDEFFRRVQEFHRAHSKDPEDMTDIELIITCQSFNDEYDRRVSSGVVYKDMNSRIRYP